MREILCRGQTEDGKWIEGGFVHQLAQKFLPEENYIFVPNYSGLHAVKINR